MWGECFTASPPPGVVGDPSIVTFKGVRLFGRLHYGDITWLLGHLSAGGSSISDFLLL